MTLPSPGGLGDRADGTSPAVPRPRPRSHTPACSSRMGGSMLHPGPLSRGAPPRSWRDTDAGGRSPPPARDTPANQSQPQGEEAETGPRKADARKAGHTQAPHPQPPPRAGGSAANRAASAPRRGLGSCTPPLGASCVCDTNMTISGHGSVDRAWRQERPGCGGPGRHRGARGAEEYPESKPTHLQVTLS